MRTVLLLIALLLLPARAEIEIRISVKFICHPNGAAPQYPHPAWTGASVDVSNYAGVAAEVDYGNQVLAATGRGCRLRLNNIHANIQPAIPGDEPQDYWYNMPARSNRATIEEAAYFDYLFGTNTWAWSPDAVNIYINNSSSGQSAFPNDGEIITMGGTIARGTLLHELGHFFHLSHTHSGDPVRTGWVPPNPLSSGLTDGDGLNETLPDHPFYNRDQLSMGNFNGLNYASLNAAQRQLLDDTWLNVMSYHPSPSRLLPIQMDHWAWNANTERAGYVSGYTIFVSTTGRDEPEFIEVRGYAPIYPLATPSAATGAVLTPNDMVLFTGGTYSAPASPITTPCTFTATRGPAVLTRP